jgi:hypothetical protein
VIDQLLNSETDLRWDTRMSVHPHVRGLPRNIYDFVCLSPTWDITWRVTSQFSIKCPQPPICLALNVGIQSILWFGTARCHSASPHSGLYVRAALILTGPLILKYPKIKYFPSQVEWYKFLGNWPHGTHATLKHVRFGA